MKLRIFLILAFWGFSFCQAPPLVAQSAQDLPGALPVPAVPPQQNGPTLSLADAEARTLKNQPRLAAEALRAEGSPAAEDALRLLHRFVVEERR